jgi:hypothetical protein
MRGLLIAAMMMGGAVPAHLNAQRGGAGGGGVGHPGFGAGGSAAGRAGNTLNRGGNHRPGLTGAGYGAYGWSYPGFYGDYGWPGTYDDEYQASPGVVVVMPVLPPPEAPPPPPPDPARPVMHEYNWPDDGGDRRETFSIVSRDSSIHQAFAVWVQDSELRYTAVDGSTGRMTPAAIDCNASERLNAEKKLKVWLPGCAASR